MHSTVLLWTAPVMVPDAGPPSVSDRALPADQLLLNWVAMPHFLPLMLSLPHEYGDIAGRMKFDDAKSNFFRAARHGLDAQFNWIDGKGHTASSLVLDHLLPLARQGLANAKVNNTDVDKYLGIIEERVRSRQTGARWILKSLEAMQDVGAKDMSQRRLTAAMLDCQKKGKPVHRWPLIKLSDSKTGQASHVAIYVDGSVYGPA